MFDVSLSGRQGQNLIYCFKQFRDSTIVLGADRLTARKSKRRTIGSEILVFFTVDLVDDEDDRLARCAQHARKLLIERRESLLCIDEKKQNIAFLNRLFDGAADYCGYFRFSRATDATCVPDHERPRPAR